MERPNIATIRGVTPMIYAHTTPEIVRHNGWTKLVIRNRMWKPASNSRPTRQMFSGIWNGKAMPF